MPVYNAEKYLCGILEDLLNQTYQNYELIIINDGSTDKSWDIIQKYAEESNKIKSVSIENQGPSKARNVGLDMATGEFVRFVDADDRISAESLEKIICPCISDNQIDLVIGNFESYSQRGYFTGDNLKEGKISQKELINIFVEYIKTFYIGVPWNKLYRRDIIEKNKIRFDENINWCEDFLFNIQYFDKVNYAYIINVKKGIYQYFICDTGITVGLENRDTDELKRIDELRYKKAREFCEKYSCLNEFEMQWFFSELYKRLTILTMYHSDLLSERYKKFKDFLSVEGTYQYVCKKYEQLNSFGWKLIKQAIEKDKYCKVFFYFLLKGYISRVIKPLRVYFEKKNVAW